MKILSILTYYYPHWTGLTAYARRIAEGLATRGHEVTILTTQHDPALPPEEVYNGVRIVRIRPLMHISRGVISPTFPLVAARLIREHDVVQIHTPLLESALVALLCRSARKPLLITHHGDLVLPAGFANRVIERLVGGMMNFAEQIATRISIHSRDYAEHSNFLRPFAPKLAYIYPPVEIPEPQAEAVAAWRRALGLEHKKLIGFAGRFVEEKGFDYLLQAIPALLAAEPDAHLIYAGERNVVYEHFYDQWKHLVDLHQDNITFVGLLRGPQRLANFYAMCDVFALPSRTDCFPSVQIEAMLSGTPVVTTDIPGAREAVWVTDMGHLVAPHNPSALAEGLVEVLRNRACYTKSRAEIRAVFNTQRTLDQYEALMAELAGLPAPHAAPMRQPDAQRPNIPVIRDRSSALPWTSLTKQDHARLDQILRNEADMAYRRRARILLDYLELQDGERVFDCGCGMGFYLKAMGELRRLHSVGLDGDTDRLRWAQRERVPAALVNGDILQLPFSDAAFDKILMSEVLEHINDDRQALHELYRVLKAGGILALSVPHARYPFWWDPINWLWIALGGQPIRCGPIAGIWSNHERLYEPAELAERVCAAGFEVEVIKEATHYSFPLIHFLVYGIGKPLIEHNLLPPALRKSADRFSGTQNSGSLLNPINLGVAIFRLIDRLNDRPNVAYKHTFVNVLLKARKPHAA
jgi:glycosyltransferase involved in cell wall biosynthesis/ubiquinone/menaquinone biosynthesis C-methylase UbiE